jgi:hypothetical protein
MYRPWQLVPFDVLDFSEFLPLLQREKSLLDRFSALLTYYAEEHGRFNVLPYALTALKWTLLGSNPALWQLTRFIQMLLIVIGVFLLLKQLGIPIQGAVTPSLLFITAGTASPGWIRLTMAEPFGTMLLLGVAWLACGYSEAPRWRRRGILIAVLLLACVLTKEMFVAIVPFVLLLALSGRNEYYAVVSGPKARWLLALSAACILLASLPIVFLAIQAPPQAFAGLYGSVPPRTSHFALNLLLFSLPESAVVLPKNSANLLRSN